jgi:NAD dependent epimerase/dehydratase family enzyme
VRWALGVSERDRRRRKLKKLTVGLRGKKGDGEQYIHSYCHMEDDVQLDERICKHMSH